MADLAELRSRAPWVGVATAVLLLVVWALSGWYRASVSALCGHSFVTLHVEAGQVQLLRLGPLNSDVSADIDWNFRAREPLRPPPPVSMESMWQRNWPTTRWYWWGMWSMRSINATSLGSRFVDLPIWPIIVLIAVPSIARLFKAARRRRPGLCPQCGYDREGISVESRLPRVWHARRASLTMPTHPKTRPATRWLSVLMPLVLAAVWTMSGWYWASGSGCCFNAYVLVRIEAGQLCFVSAVPD